MKVLTIKLQGAHKSANDSWFLNSDARLVLCGVRIQMFLLDTYLHIRS